MKEEHKAPEQREREREKEGVIWGEGGDTIHII